MSGHLARSESFPPRPVYPRRFGNFVLLSEMGHGGMGQVYLAKKSQMLGIDRYCVLKTLRAEHSDKSEYLGRFLDEARVAVHLNHRNICAVTDVGMHGDTLFMAMDLVVGCDLYTVHDALAAKRRRLPDAIALYLIHEMLDALDYAHRLRDPVSDEPLSIVHRDVSPANIMLSFEGEVKLIDFGLANSKLKTEHTRGDYVMGKLAYLSPEQATNQELDARSDQFSAAIVAYELLTGERFYEGLIPQAIWKRAGTGEHEPRRMKELDPELIAILRRALAANRDQRYSSCAGFRQAIDEYRLRRGMVARGQEAREFMESLFPDAQKKHRERLAQFANIEMPDAEPSLTGLRKPISMEGAPVEDPMELSSGETPASGPGASGKNGAGAHGQPDGRASGPQASGPQGLVSSGPSPYSFDVALGTSGAMPSVQRRATLMTLVAGALLFTLVGVVGVLLLQRSPPANAATGPAGSPGSVDPAPPLPHDVTPPPDRPATPTGDPSSSPTGARAAVGPDEEPSPSEAKPPPRATPRKNGTERRTPDGSKPTRVAADTGGKPAVDDPPDATARPQAEPTPERRPPARAVREDKRPKRPAPTSTTGKLELLRSCDEPCAKRVLKMSEDLTKLDIKDVRRYPQLLDQCVERCR